MTTYDGRAASYIPGRDVVNKEPPVSKYVVEKLYRVHRERIMKAEPVVDNHIEIPNFLLNQTWKKNAEKQRKIVINRTNRQIYERLEKLEKNESILAKENRLHVERIETKLHYLTKLKKHGRLVNLVKIQKENEYMLRRLEKTKPLYTLKECKDWYKHHELYKQGRRTDPTGGHIMHGMKGLLPPPLPPITEESPSVKFSKADELSSILKSKYGSKSQGSMVSSPSMNVNGQTGLDNGSTWRTASLTSNSMISSTSNVSYDKPNSQQQKMNSRGKTGKRGTSTGDSYDQEHQIMVISEGSETDTYGDDDFASLSQTQSQSNSNSRSMNRTSTISSSYHQQQQQQQQQQSYPTTIDNQSLTSTIFNHSDLGSHNSSMHSLVQQNPTNIPNISLDGNESIHTSKESPGIHSERAETEYGSEDDNHSQNSMTGSVYDNLDNNNGEDLMLLSSRPFAIPFDSKNCLVQVYSARSYDENLYLKVVSSGVALNVLVERSLPIDKAYEIVNAGGHSSQIIHSTDNEDLQTLSTLLINMFKEADDDGSGSLTFDEFQALMERVELGISPQELRFVITEADENENGVVDYDEFVPLAVDLIQSFRARNRAKAFISQQHVMVDDQILRSISSKELEETAKVCLEKVFEFDSKKYGLIRVPELKKCLNSVTGSHALQENEISMLCEMLPKDQFGRIKYNSTPTAFTETLSKVRFMTMKNAIIETQGSGLQRYLLDLCKDEEARINHYKGMKEKFVPTGIIPCPSLINILSNSSRLSLSRLQVLVIMSEASVLDGMINYFQFVPMVAKCIELMFEPKALRQRAELIEKTDLSPEALLQGMNSDMFEQRLLTLFKSYDIDHNGFLDQNEFIACLESLDLHLTKSEMAALMSTADVEHRGYLKFDEFVRFFQNNLLSLEKEKKIRALQSSMHTNKHGKHRRSQMQDKHSQQMINQGSGPSILGNFNTDNNNNNSNTTTNSGNSTNNNSNNNSNLVRVNSSRPSTRSDSRDQNDEENDRNMLDTLQSIFKLSDPENTGFISYEEFDSIMKNFSTHSTSFLMDVLLSELTMTEDGMVDYNESLATCGDLLKVMKAKASAQEEMHEREKWAEEKANQLVQSAVPDIQHIVKYLKRKIKKLNEKGIDPVTRFLEVQEIIRSPQCGLSKNESHVVLTRLFQGVISNTPMGTAGSKSFNFANTNHPTTTGSSNNSHNNSGNNLGAVAKFRQSILSTDSTDSNHMPTQPTPSAVGNNHHNKMLYNNNNGSSSFSMSPRGGGAFPMIALRASAQFSQNPKILRTNFTTQELFDAVFEARRVNIMRGLLQEFDKTSTRQVILSQLQAELNKKHANGEVALESSYLPVKSCFDILENTPTLRLNRAQVLFILSWAECFDREGIALEIHKFADHAASIIERLHIPEVLETRAEVISQGTLDDRKVFNGLRERDLAGYIEAACMKACEGDEDGMISNTKLRDILKDIPRLKLNERDIATIIAGLPWIQDELPAQEIIPPAITSIRSLFRERMIHRRVSLIATTANNHNRYDSIEARKIQEESLNHLKQLADKLLNYIKIILQGDALVINLPIDQMTRRSSQLLEDSFNTKHHSVTLLFRGARFVPLHNIKSVVTALDMNSPMVGGMGPALLVSRKQHRETSPALNTIRPQVQVISTQVNIPAFLQILMVEDTRLYSGCTLLANVVSADGTINCHDSVSVKMPSAGLVDEEAAKQFAINLVDRIYLERREDGDRIVSLKVVMNEIPLSPMLGKKEVRVQKDEPLYEPIIFDSIEEEFNTKIFFHQLLIHLLFPFVFTSPNPRAQKFDNWYEVFSLFMMYLMIIIYTFLPADYHQGQFRFAYALPLLYYVQHKLVTALKYASLSNTEYNRFMNNTDKSLSAIYLSQMQLITGWLERDESVLNFELGAAAIRVGVNLSEVKIYIPAFRNCTRQSIDVHDRKDPTLYNAQYHQWNAFLRGRAIIDLSLPPSAELKLLALPIKKEDSEEPLRSQDDIVFTLSTLDLCSTLIHNADTREFPKYNGFKLAFYLNIFSVMIPYIAVIYKHTTLRADPFLILFIISATYINYIYGYLVFKILFAAVFDVLRTHLVMKELSKLIRVHDLIYKYDFQETSKQQKIADQNARAIMSAGTGQLRKFRHGRKRDRQQQRQQQQSIDLPAESITGGSVNHEHSTIISDLHRDSLAKEDCSNHLSMNDYQEADTPRISFDYPENIAAWTYARLIFQNFGNRFRARTDIYIAGTVLCTVFLAALTLIEVFTSEGRVKPLESISSLQGFIQVVITSIFLVIYSFVSANINEEMISQSQILLRHKMKISCKQRALKTELQYNSSMTESTREKISSEIEGMEDVLIQIESSVNALDVENEQRPFKIFGIAASASFTSSVITTLVSFYGSVISAYNSRNHDLDALIGG